MSILILLLLLSYLCTLFLYSMVNFMRDYFKLQICTLIYLCNFFTVIYLCKLMQDNMIFLFLSQNM